MNGNRIFKVQYHKNYPADVCVEIVIPLRDDTSRIVEEGLAAGAIYLSEAHNSDDTWSVYFSFKQDEALAMQFFLAHS